MRRIGTIDLYHVVGGDKELAAALRLLLGIRACERRGQDYNVMLQRLLDEDPNP